MIINDVLNKKVGYKVNSDLHSYGAELFTHKRVSAMLFTFHPSTAGEEKNVLTIWADKTRYPERKLEIILTTGSSKRNTMNGFKSSLVFKHPLLPRDLEYRVEHYKGNRNQMHTKIDFEVFDDHHKRWVLEHNVKPAEDNAFITDIELHSQGTGDSVVFEYNQREKYNRYDYESFSASANLKFKEKNAVKKELLVQLESFAETFIIRMGSPVKQMSLEHNWNPHNRTDGVHTQTITQLFGLSPSVLTVDFDQYFSNFNVKVYSKATPEIVYRLTGDVSFDSKLEVELVHQIGSEKKELALFSSKVNDHGILGTRLSWKIEDLSAMRSAIQSRYQTVTSQVHYTFQQLVKDLQMSSSKWAAFKNLRPGLRNLASDMAVEAKTFMKDTEEDESLEEILPVLKQIYVHLHLSTEYISSHISFENIGKDTIRVIKATIDNLYTSAAVYYRNLQTYLFDNRRLAGAIQSKNSLTAHFYFII